ncbi:MAG: DUF2520 domain-containing protein [Cytophagales bacterium]|nr:DUF2520 domain-containing protein [Cytophagales bacterium]
MQDLKIGLVGTGRVAWHLGPALENAGHRVAEVYGRNPKPLKEMLARLYSAESNSTLDFSGKKLDLVILCVADRAIEEVCKEIILDEETVLVHTAGNGSMESLRFAGTDRIGVFYPLQTFSKEKDVDMEQVPVCVEGNSREVSRFLTKLAKTVSNKVRYVSSEDRRVLHVGAVFACNFSNHMLRIAQELLGRKGLEVEMLHPLLAETLNKSIEIGPAQAQTGPAVRGDFETLDRHMNTLGFAPELQEIYQKISQNILDKYFYKEKQGK